MFDSSRPHGLQPTRLLCPSEVIDISPGNLDSSFPSPWWVSIAPRPLTPKPEAAPAFYTPDLPEAESWPGVLGVVQHVWFFWSILTRAVFPKETAVKCLFHHPQSGALSLQALLKPQAPGHTPGNKRETFNFKKVEDVTGNKHLLPVWGGPLLCSV